MILLRKLKTAIRIITEKGAGEVSGLARDNILYFFVSIGRLFSRLWNKIYISVISKVPRHSEKPRILYVTSKFEAYHSQTVRYRIHNFRKALRNQADTVFEIIDPKTKFKKSYIRWADIIVLMRVTWVPQADAIIKTAKEFKKPVIFDIDDLIFLPHFAPDYCKVLCDTSEENQIKRANEFKGFEKTFKECDYATASTPFIAGQIKNSGKKAFVIHNSLNKKQLSIARRSKKPVNNIRAIGYLSGTKTHDKDFMSALSAIEKIMAEYHDVVLNVAGYLDLDLLPPLVRKRTRSYSYMNWTRLMRFGAKNYMNIAPLDIDNPFCHAKSELKFFEAAAAFVPTIASKTDTYARCIQNGVNGMLASAEEEWYSSMKKLLDDKDFYRLVSENAHSYAIEHYSPRANAAESLDAYKTIIQDFHGE